MGQGGDEIYKKVSGGVMCYEEKQSRIRGWFEITGFCFKQSSQWWGKQESAGHLRKASSNQQRENGRPWTYGGRLTSFTSKAQYLGVYWEEGRKEHSRDQELHEERKGNWSSMSSFRNDQELGVIMPQESSRLLYLRGGTGTGAECLAYHASEFSLQETKITAWIWPG